MLKKLSTDVGQLALHVLDRGYANIKMLEWFTEFEQLFVIRWKINHLLVNEQGVSKQTHLVARSYKGKDVKMIWDEQT